MINKTKLKFWLDHNLNVILEGHAGVGKTAVISESFTQRFGEINEKWLYFSAATMDAYIDLIGVPRESKDEKGSFLEMVRPKVLRDDEIEAIFLDEYNRAPKAVRNAVMELIQFKSINGRPFKNLKIVWVAINPYDENGTYDVEKLDPAQLDRFHIHYKVPYELDAIYFKKKFGKEVAEIAKEYWDKLDDDVRRVVSPRRMDYALEIHLKGGFIREDVIPTKANPKILIEKLSGVNRLSDFMRVLEEGTKAEVKKFLANDANFFACKEHIVENPDTCLAYLAEERVSSLMDEFPKIDEYVTNNPKTFKSLLAERESQTEDFNVDTLKNADQPEELIFWVHHETTWENAKDMYKKIVNKNWRFRRTKDEIARGLSAKAAFEERRNKLTTEFGVAITQD